jgi:hypothetical protein
LLLFNFGSSTVVEPVTYHLEVVGLSPAVAGGTKFKKWQIIFEKESARLSRKFKTNVVSW